MQHISKRTIFSIINVLLILALFIFIFGHSLDDRATSSQESLRVLAFLKRILGYDHLTNHMVRKLAHFCEFAALGFVTLQLCAVLRRMQWHYMLHSLSLGLACAVMDESIQLLSDRDSQVSDILLDFSGVMVGWSVFLLLYTLFYTAHFIWQRHAARKP